MLADHATAACAARSRHVLRDFVDDDAEPRQRERLVAGGLVAARIELRQRQPFGNRLNHLGRLERVRSRANAMRAIFFCRAMMPIAAATRRARSTVKSLCAAETDRRRGGGLDTRRSAIGVRNDLEQLAAELLRRRRRGRARRRSAPTIRSRGGPPRPSNAATITRSVSADRGSPTKTSIGLDFCPSVIADIMHACPWESRAVGLLLHVSLAGDHGVVRGRDSCSRAGVSTPAQSDEQDEKKEPKRPSLSLKAHTRNRNGARPRVRDGRVQGRR